MTTEGSLLYLSYESATETIREELLSTGIRSTRWQNWGIEPTSNEYYI